MVKTISTKWLTDEEWQRARAELLKDRKQIGDFIAEKIREYLESKEEK